MRVSQLGNNLANYPSLNVVVERLIERWPEHARYCKARFDQNTPELLHRTDEYASLALRLVGADLVTYLDDYRWMCEQFLVEELYFRRHGVYRLSTFREAFDEVYNDPGYMSKYVHGILISQIIWDPHARAFDLFRTKFVAEFQPGSSYLEVGPGHGLFLYFASQQEAIDRLVAWDVSKSSIQATTSALKTLKVSKSVSLIEQDVLVAPPEPESFDGAVISEVLEHLEDPGKALDTLYKSLKPGGRIFINIPINSPAPDHIYLWRSTDEVVELIESSGFTVSLAKYFPVTGVSLDVAIEKDFSISCVFVGIK